MQDVTEFKRIEELRLEQERREKMQVKDTFSRYMGPRLVDHLLSHEPGLMARRERRHAVVMFADLRNWTGGMIAKVSPDEAINQLNEFFTHMMEIALDNDGTVFELTGDELLVGFNAPFDQENAVYLAVKTAVTMQHKFNALRQGWYKRAGTELGLGIGIDQGDVLMGNVGAESRLSFRMVGEAMNKSHRLVELAEDGQVVISKSLYRALETSAPKLTKRIKFTPIGPVKLKGIPQPQLLYATQVARPPLKK
jgi:adenylate cyclase